MSEACSRCKVLAGYQNELGMYGFRLDQIDYVGELEGKPNDGEISLLTDESERLERLCSLMQSGCKGPVDFLGIRICGSDAVSPITRLTSRL